MITERRCYTNDITIEGTKFELICIEEDGTYSFYIQPADLSYALAFVIGFPMNQQSLEEAYNLAEETACDSIDIINENNWDGDETLLRDRTAKSYHIKPEHLSEWGEECDEDTVITEDELQRLSQEWDKPVEELLDQLEEID